MVQVNSILIGRAFYGAVQEIPCEIATKVLLGSDIEDNARNRFLVEKLLGNKTPSDSSLETLGDLWLESYPTTKEAINGYLKRCGLQTVDDFIQLQSLKS